MLTINNIGEIGTHEHAYVNLVEMDGNHYVFRITNKTKTASKGLFLNRIANGYGKYTITIEGDVSPEISLPIEDIRRIDIFVGVLRYINDKIWPFS